MRPEELRKRDAVAAALSNVLRRSRLKDWLDPDELASTVTAKFEVLYTGGAFDLAPLWDALSAAYNPQALVGLFLRFRQELERLGLKARLPLIIERLPEEQRRAHLEHFELAADLAVSAPAPQPLSRSADLTPLPTLEMMDPEPIPLTSADLRPIIPEDLKRRVVHAVVQCVKGSPIGWRVNSAQLRQLVSQNFEKLCDGVNFDFEPILQKLLRDEGVSEADAYIAVVRLIEQLRRQHIVMAEPRMSLGEALKARLWEEAMNGPSDDRPPSDIGQLLPGQKTIRLGELLLKYQLITEEQLQQALRAQQMYGGRLGTNLIELGFVEETALTHFLSVQLNLPAINPADLNKLSPQVLAVLPPEIAKKYRVIPLAVDKKKLRLAMIDPTDLAVIDEVTFLTGHRVQPVVAPEALVAYALEAYYGVPRTEARRPLEVPSDDLVDDKFQVVHVSWRPNTTTRQLQREANAAALAQGLGQPLPGVEGPPIELRSADLHLEMETDRINIAPPEVTLGSYASALARAVSVTDVHRAVLDQCAALFDRVALFQPEGGDVVGLGQRGTRLTDDEMAQLRLPLQMSALFQQLYTTLRQHVGPPPRSPHDVWTLGRFDIAANAPILGLPLVEKQRVVSFVIAAGRRDGDLYRDASVYEKIAEKAGLALQMISLRKQILQP